MGIGMFQEFPSKEAVKELIEHHRRTVLELLF